MAHKNSITVRSSKKSVISKVEVVTVPANNVNSITSRHPVAVVVAEKLCPSATERNSKNEPKRVYIPGCPIPQILSQEMEKYNVADSSRNFSRQTFPVRRSFKSERNKLNHQDPKPSKAVTFQIDKVTSFSDNPKEYECSHSSSSDIVDSSVTSDVQSGTSGEDQPTIKTQSSSVPRYVLVSKGMRGRYQMESYSDAKANNIQKTNLSCNFCSTPKCKCMRGSSETVNTSDNETERDGERLVIGDDLPSQRESNLGTKFAYDRPARDTVEASSQSDDSFDNENQRQTFKGEQNINFTDESVKPVKSGSFHIRQRPHVLETKREYNADDYRSDVSQKPVSYKKVVCKSKKDICDHSRSRGPRPASASASMEVRGVSISKRDKQKYGEAVNRMKTASISPKSGAHPSRVWPTQSRSKTEDNITKIHSERARKPPAKSRSLPGTPTKKPTPKRGEKFIGDDPESSYRSPSPETPPPPSVFPLDLTEVYPVTEVPLNEGGGSPPAQQDFGGVGEHLDLKDFVALAKWAERKREDLGRNPVPSFGQTSSRISALLKDLTSDTFDEDKYRLTRRIESYFNRAYHSALTDFNKPEVSASPANSLDDRSTLPLTSRIIPPEDPRLPTTAILTSTTTTTTAITGVSLGDEHLRNIYSRPPPLFSHRWVTQTQTTATTSIPVTESSPGYAKPSHQRRGRCFTKTKLRGRRVKPGYFPSPDGRDPAARRTSPTTPRASRKEPENKVKKPRLEVIHQRGVSIPAGNVAEKTAVISISPRTKPLVPKKKKKKNVSVVEVVHQSVNNDTSGDDVTENDEDSDVDESSDERRLSEQRRREEPEVKCSPVSDERGPLTPRGVAQSVSSGSHSVDEGDEEPQRSNGSPSIDEYDEEPQRDSVQPHHGDASPHSQNGNGIRDSYSPCDSEGELPVSEAQDLPGYMPEVKWEEVTMDNRREEEEEAEDREKTTRNIREAEGRLYEYELRERILSGLEDRLGQLVLTGQEQWVGVPPVTSEEEEEEEGHQPESFQGSEDLNGQQLNVASEAVRTLLYSLVRDRLLGIPQRESSESEVPEPSAKRPQEVPSPVSYSSSYENDVGTSAPVATPTSSPRREDENVAKIPTPSSSPTPLLPPENAVIQNQRVLTPQNSMEAIEDTHSEEAIATPSLSPPSGRSVIEVGSSVTPAVTPTISPVRGKQMFKHIITSVTPSRTPASSPEKLKRRYPAETPALSPAGSPGRLVPKYPDAGTPGQSPLPSDREIGVVNTPPRSPSPSRTYDVVVSVPQSPSSPLSPANTRNEPFTSRPGPEEAPGTHRMEKPRQVLSPRYFDRGTQAESYRGIRERRVDRGTTAVVLDDSQDLTFDDTPSVVCNSSAEPTVYSPVEVSDTTFFTISEGEVVGGQGSVNASVEDGEIARTCYLETPEGLPVICSSHKGLRPSVNEGELKSESEIEIITDNNEESSSISGKPDTNDPASYTAEDYSLLSTKATGSELSVVQDDTYSSGDVTGVSAESIDALRHENAILLHRLRNLGSFGFLGPGSQSSSSESIGET
ncbi:protein bassoon-like isoform X2 [Macrobrachium rosenbergii]|uniref:protein bassoon-like isoform X2 n=1 Tax=Macrobrachium rosenbergii TaxID=79674 RepID=UPI0034D5F101